MRPILSALLAIGLVCLSLGSRVRTAQRVPTRPDIGRRGGESSCAPREERRAVRDEPDARPECRGIHSRHRVSRLQLRRQHHREREPVRSARSVRSGRPGSPARRRQRRHRVPRQVGQPDLPRFAPRFLPAAGPADSRHTLLRSQGGLRSARGTLCRGRAGAMVGLGGQSRATSPAYWWPSPPRRLPPRQPRPTGISWPSTPRSTSVASDYWADYPGFEVDEEAVYITMNMFPFSGSGSFTRLWIIDKGLLRAVSTPVGRPSWSMYDPVPPGLLSHDHDACARVRPGAGSGHRHVSRRLQQPDQRGSGRKRVRAGDSRRQSARRPHVHGGVRQRRRS